MSDTPAAAADSMHAWVDRAPLAVGVVRGLVVVYANDRLLELLGLTAQRDKPIDILDCIAVEDQPRVRERHARRMRGEVVPASYELFIVRPDGERRLVEVKAPGVEDLPEGNLAARADDLVRAGVQADQQRLERRETLGQRALDHNVRARGLERRAEAREGMEHAGTGLALGEVSDLHHEVVVWPS